MRILLITLTLAFTLVTLGAAPAFADKVVIVNNGCDHDDYRHRPEHKRWKKQHRHERREEYREVHHYHHYESRSRRPAGGHYVAIGGPTFGVFVTGR
ncbi:hypothetical protein PCS_03381 [Desulfocurvibacter africanus PCS]|uniref:Uncharacterized protein n=1 Tax=Desulfocurvibacter africanus PCS TaxID=1262666 RepID=M5Q0R1_DESAF|nr:hypothetical protein [Desulfocurvibacter africanus]EMG35898.1 hypothetical protein PCS_03381 [Desulfocurvibacter africanus PCS]